MPEGVYDNITQMWFGTKEKMGWIPAPQTGADVSPEGSSAASTLLDGGAFVRNSWDSHKNYQFGWSNSAALTLASKLHGYANGSYGRGLIYFHDPMYYDTNVLSRRVADPSMALDYEAPAWLSAIQPTGTPTPDNALDLPVQTTVYNIPAGYVHDPADSIWVPIPAGMELWLGAIYSTSGNATAGIVVDDGTTKSLLAQLPVTGATVASQAFSGVAGVNIYPGFAGSNATAGTVSITALTARVRTVTGQLESYTNLFTNPDSLAGTGTIEVRRNLCTNPSFETSSISWGTQGAATLLRTTEQAHSGLYSLRVTAPTVGVGPIHNVNITAGAIHTASSWVYSEADASISVYMSYFTGGTFDGDTSTVVNIPSGWSQVSFTNSRATSNVLRFGLRSRTAGQVWWMDDVTIEQATRVFPFFSGDTANTNEFAYAWTGTANESASTATATVPTGTSTTGAATTVWKSFDGGPTGGSFTRVRVDASAGNIGLGFIDSALPVSGSAYTVTMFARAVNRDQIVEVRVRSIRGGAMNLPLGQWVQISATVEAGTAPANQTGILILGASPQQAGDIIDFAVHTMVDAPSVAAPYTGSPFSGSTPSTDGVIYTWNGTPDASTSTLQKVGPITSGPWMSGEGHSGARFVGKPTLVNYSGIDGGQVGLGASLREVQPWA